MFQLKGTLLPFVKDFKNWAIKLETFISWFNAIVLHYLNEAALE